MRAPRHSGPATAPSLLLGVTVGRAREGTREAGSGSPVQSRRPARPVLGTLAGVGGGAGPRAGALLSFRPFVCVSSAVRAVGRGPRLTPHPVCCFPAEPGLQVRGREGVPGLPGERRPFGAPLPRGSGPQSPAPFSVYVSHVSQQDARLTFAHGLVSGCSSDPLLSQKPPGPTGLFVVLDRGSELAVLTGVTPGLRSPAVWAVCPGWLLHVRSLPSKGDGAR